MGKGWREGRGGEGMEGREGWGRRGGVGWRADADSQPDATDSSRSDCAML